LELWTVSDAYWEANMKKLRILLGVIGVLSLAVLISSSSVGYSQEDSSKTVAAKLDALLRLT